jgi:microsomal dipeptidase-like Zn-dependent dipeptidase
MRRFPVSLDYMPAVCALAVCTVAATLLFAQTGDSPAISARARALHAGSLVFDGHIHAVDREFYHGGDIGERKADGQFDLPRAREGGLGALFFSIFVTEDYYPGRLETKQALRMLDCAIEQIRRNSDRIAIARTASEIESIRAGGKIAAVLDIEGSFDLDGDPAVIRQMYRLGMRSVQLSAHNWTSNYADSCCSAAKWHGLNDRGRELIREMNRLGMVINVSHASDDAISAAIDASSVPVVATHHGLRAVNDIPRNMPDWLLKKLAAKGGVIGFQIGNEFHNRRAFDWVTAHAGKAFWDTSHTVAWHAGAHRGTRPIGRSAVSDEARRDTAGDPPDRGGLGGYRGSRHPTGGRRPRGPGVGLRWRTALAARHARYSRLAHDHRCHAAPRLLRREDPKIPGRQPAAGLPGSHRAEIGCQ